jgi:hypothetical protein
MAQSTSRIRSRPITNRGRQFVSTDQIRKDPKDWLKRKICAEAQLHELEKQHGKNSCFLEMEYQW